MAKAIILPMITLTQHKRKKRPTFQKGNSIFAHSQNLSNLLMYTFFNGEAKKVFEINAMYVSIDCSETKENL